MRSGSLSARIATALRDIDPLRSACASRGVLRRSALPTWNRSVREPKVTVIWKSFNENQTVYEAAWLSQAGNGDRTVRRSSPGRPETHQDNQRAAHFIGESGPKELGGDQRNNQPMSESGQKRQFGLVRATSALPLKTDIHR